MSNMKVVGIIPARLESKRFPGKALADINGKPLIVHVYERAKQVLDDVFVATDNNQIANAVLTHGGKVIFTGSDCRNGTERCARALTFLNTVSKQYPEIVINIQGDQPEFDPSHIKSIIEQLYHPRVCLCSLMIKTKEKHNTSIVKVVVDKHSDAIYFSRYPISNMKHIGIYGYWAPVLPALAELLPTENEVYEDLEQLRWISNGYSIRMIETEIDSPSIDLAQDLLYLEL
ncbi:MAG TPA: 3-deoxy-manno-octulosonate cytidylyltransferase [Methanosarcinales archaeon]|nr:3-deoxy-manno-octulosonate cytidylyltransferase [Methanosarcinales archaeon]